MKRSIARWCAISAAAVGYDRIDSPLGPLCIVVGPNGLLSVDYGKEPSASTVQRVGDDLIQDARRVAPVARQLDQYFRGKRQTFDVPVDITHLTLFQRRVLKATARVSYGELTTYGAVAKRAGNERASRAAGAALGRNPIPIVIPCHRIVASDGSLGGYSGGLKAKRTLLALERSGDVPLGGRAPANGRR